MAFINLPVDRSIDVGTLHRDEPSDPKACAADTDCTNLTINGKTYTGRTCIDGFCSCPFSYGGDNCKEDICGLTNPDGGCIDSGVGSCILQQNGAYKCICVVSRAGDTCQLCSQATQNVSGLICVHNSCVSDGKSCSGNGICVATSVNAFCSCFHGYNGEHCELNACGVYKSSDDKTHYCGDHGICYLQLDSPESMSTRSVYSCRCFPGVTGGNCSVVTNYGQQIFIFTMTLIVEIIALAVLVTFLLLRLRKQRIAKAKAKFLEDSDVE